ncbi:MULTISPECIES: DUF1761 domain-containing protein [Cryobacterium]|uniref:DUF1761 domain-containing protein n=1 Tax=Cryobacterium zongtaii TaxID=1259217 RepID=A0A2S3ZN78_9MICO|nr:MULTISPECIES: DUF1761 domain-containing protein [Cryobacterium]ASD23052.1 hypothetical protein B7495_13860 [Cryobacterium sp. LW097]MEC5184949.1 hypothetical protein [Cryobacterium sp. MP_3.1]POH68590.1 DUF1761 domain-containing protein [Cryobacterium zongtaii]POH70206.1 DUF1761 domain-containing protein [Cryobacterium zongtaii]TFC48469.1 DUF1761 domain-containing protein [Cryobacterium sp. TMN-39-2]
MDVSFNWLAVALAALSSFVIGGLWYSVVFARPWQRAAGVTDEQLKHGTARVFIGSAILAIVMAISLAAFIGSNGPGFGTFAGFATGSTFVAAAFGVNYLFERRSLVLFAINGSYNVVSFTVMGAIIGLLQ